MYTRSGVMPSKRPVRSGLVAERPVALHALVCSADRLLGVQLDLLVCDALLESVQQTRCPANILSRPC
jgi:hypothetical protein